MNFDALNTGRTLVLGFGREGRALEHAVGRRAPGARIEVVCDRAPDVAPRDWPLRIGTPDSASVEPDRVLRSPGVPVDLPALVRWREAGKPVTCVSSLWFGERPDARVIAVTGSKGKSTTAALIAHLLAASGKSVALGGNIGVPMLDLLEDRSDWFVIELSSYQLADLQGHATAAVITRLFPEHQDWHGGVANYYAAKLRVADLLDGGPLWINGADPLLAQAVADLPNVRPVNIEGTIRVADDGIRYQGRRLMAASDSPLVGRHNLDNLALALGVIESIGGQLESGCESLASFRPLRHRLEPIPGPDDRRWINDSIATTPYATLAALQASPPHPVLIVGGLERGADWRMVAEFCRENPLGGLVGLPDNGPAICRLVADAGGVEAGRVSVAENMPEAVAAARDLSKPDGVILLSPGAPSFPRFRDFEQRGNAFRSAVTDLA
jgi:UDP-N-acetylmuramoylalanine--D-glutamate ligase